MGKATPLHEVFLPRAQGIAHLMRSYIEAWDGSSSTESMSVEQIENKDGTVNLRFWRRRWQGRKGSQGLIEFRNIQAADPQGITFGPETLLRSQLIGATSQTVDNSEGYAPVEINLGDLFGKEDTKESASEKSAGGSIKISAEAEQSVEGVASFKESVEAEAHTEMSESSSQSQTATHEDTGEETTEVPEGKCIVITESRARADTSQQVTAQGEFTFALAIGAYVHHVKPQHKMQVSVWESWTQFKDVVNRDAPDNWPMAMEFKKKHAYHADLWALQDLKSPLRYLVKFEGKIIRKYSVRKCG